VINDLLCDGCGVCVDECPIGAIELNDVAHVDVDLCDDCGMCITACPNDAIKLE
jgi:ferredoxin